MLRIEPPLRVHRVRCVFCQLATNMMDTGDFSSTAAAVSPKNSLSPERRLTPSTTIRSCPRFFASVRMASRGARSARYLGARRHVVAVGNLDDLLHDRLLLPATTETAATAPVVGAGRADAECRDRAFAGTGDSDGDFGGAARHLASGHRNEDAGRNCLRFIERIAVPGDDASGPANAAAIRLTSA